MRIGRRMAWTLSMNSRALLIENAEEHGGVASYLGVRAQRKRFDMIEDARRERFRSLPERRDPDHLVDKSCANPLPETSDDKKRRNVIAPAGRLESHPPPTPSREIDPGRRMGVSTESRGRSLLDSVPIFDSCSRRWRFTLPRHDAALFPDVRASGGRASQDLLSQFRESGWAARISR